MIDRNQVDVTEHVLKNARQFFRMFRAVIDAADQGVFKGNSSSSFGDIVAQRLHDIVERKAAVDRH
ncbi:hypothetical protein D1872_327270 [compost metagenome]